MKPFTRIQPSNKKALQALALALACLTTACAAPSLSTQGPRSMRAQALDAEAQAITVKPVEFGPDGTATVEFEATEAILALANPTPDPLPVRAEIAGGSPFKTSFQVASLGGKDHQECGIRPLRRLKGLEGRPSLRRSTEAPAEPRTLQATMSFVFPAGQESPNIPVPQATRLYEGTHCLIYLDDRDADWLTPEEAQALGQQFDEQSYPAIKQVFGEEMTHPGDDFNYGQDKTIFLFSRGLAEVDPTYAGMVDVFNFVRPEVMAPFGIQTNYAKIAYILPESIGEMTPGTMAHEFVHILFDTKRAQSYNQVHGKGGPFGHDVSYYMDDTTYFAELGMNEGFGELGKFLSGYAPDDIGTAADRIGKFLGRAHLGDLFRFYGFAGSNYGEMSLVNSYLYGLNPDFPKQFMAAQATGSAAISEAMGRDFADLFRDFSLALVLDGLSPQVPARYQIPMVDLHKTYPTSHGSLIPLRGANDSTAPLLLTGPGRHGLRFTRVHVPSGKGKLIIKGHPSLKANLILLKGAAQASFQEN